MFDHQTYVGPTRNNTTVNAVSGSILRNHSKSWFETFFMDSQRAKELLQEDGHKASKREYFEDVIHTYWKRDPEQDIIVLQMMLCGENRVIAELIRRKDYENENHEESQQ